MPNLQLQVFKAKWTKPLQKILVILASRNSSRKERKIERILDNKWSITGLPQQLDNNQQLRKRKHQRTLKFMAGIPKLQDGPTASFQLPCNIKWVKMGHLMEHTAEVHLKDKYLRAMGER